MNVFKSNKNDVLLEEEKNLESNLTKIDEKISNLKQDLIRDEKECNSYRGDYDYISEFREYKDRCDKTRNEINKIQTISESPYFGHMYLYEDEEDEDIFIGESSIINSSGTNIVYDWRSPVCSLFYANQQSKKHNGYDFVVKFKRQIEIKNRKINKCIETYNDNKDKVITDSFLKEVLREKKNNSEFTDIIKTIQEKQNEIIRNDIDRNIICQGVAGSGKTVIIIHRISYLLFNHPKIRPDEFLFIAPNDNFKSELNQLNRKLEIDKIRLITLYEYYIEKFNVFLNMSETEKYKLTNVINDSNIDIQKEYSYETLNNKYSLIADDMLRNINELKIKYNITYNDIELSLIDKYKKVYSFLSDRVRIYSENINKIKNNFKQILENQSFLPYDIEYNSNLKNTIDNFLQETTSNKIQLENKLKNIEQQYNMKNNLIFKFFGKDIRTELENLKLTINNLNNLITLNDNKLFFINNISKFYNNLVKLDNHIKIADDYKWKLLNFINRFTYYISNNNDFIKDNIKLSNITNNISEINECVEILIKMNYSEDNNNLKFVYNSMIPRNVITSCFEKICIGNYKLNTNFSNKSIYRIDIFTILYILEKLGYSKQSSYRYLYIDEAQDYNDVEIELVKKYEQQSILNIFGDYKQNISNNSLLRNNWNNLKDIIKNNFDYYELNENYRNTTNVVEYCNKTLQLNMMAIGIDGKDVQVNYFNNIDDVILKAKMTNAIIITKNNHYLEYIANDNQVKAYDIVSVKGLEFPNVVVIDDGFTPNEKYVAFTRSLGTLIIYQVNK